MKPLVNFQGKLTANGIQFTWDVKALENDAYIILVGIIGSGDSIKINQNCVKLLSLQSMEGDGSSYLMQNMSGSAGVQKAVFCGLSSETKSTDEEILEMCRSNPDCMISVMMGRADIEWSDHAKVVDNVKIITFELNSNTEISQGVLGYQYSYGSELIMKLPFPDRVHQGKHNYPPILIPKDCDISVVPYDDQFKGNLNIKKKKKRLFFN